MDSDFDETNNEEEGEEDKGVRSIVENGKPFPGKQWLCWRLSTEKEWWDGGRAILTI